MCDQQPTAQIQIQHRLSAPAQPTASLIQPGHTDLSSPPERPLRAPAYPLSSRPLLGQQDSVQKSASTHNKPQQTSPQPFPCRIPARQAAPGAEPPGPTTPERTSQLPLRAWTRQLFTCHRTSPPRPSISYPIVPPDNTPVDQFENPRPAPLPPTLSRPDLSPATLPPPYSSLRSLSPPPPYSPPDQTLIMNSATEARAPANRRPMSVPPALREFSSSPSATDFPDARNHRCSRAQSLQLGRFALCGACHRVRHCITGLGAGRVICNECFREHFLDGKE